MEISLERLRYRRAPIAALLISTVMAACGGGGSSGSSAAPASTASTASTVSTTASNISSQATGNQQLSGFASEGFEWFNLRRQQVGLAQVSRNPLLDSAAQGHSTYQKLNDTISHDQISGRPGFTGRLLRDRFTAAGYNFTQSSFTFGEVISATTDGSGRQAAESLIGAIYHRYVIYEPMFREAGAGADMVTGGYTYFTVNFSADGLNTGLGRGKLVVYPVPNQAGVDRSVFSDRETPDPIPGQNEVGYPVSVHADIVGEVFVQAFSVRPRGGDALPATLLTSFTDARTPASAAALVPTGVLAPATTYDVQFTGIVDRVPVSKAWSFTTR